VALEKHHDKTISLLMAHSEIHQSKSVGGTGYIFIINISVVNENVHIACT
jgi:hypothetical protein